MRSYKKIMPILLIVAMLGSVVYSVKQKLETQNAYNTAIAEAQHYVTLGAYHDAVIQYSTALELKRSEELEVEIGEMLIKAEDYRGAMSWYEESMRADYPNSPEIYAFGMRLYADRNYFDEFFTCYETYQNRHLNDEQVEALYQEYRDVYTLSGYYEDVGVFNPNSGLVNVKYNGNWGMVNNNARTIIYYQFQELGYITDLVPAITKDGRAIYLDSQGNEKINQSFILEKDPDFGTVKAFQPIHTDMILAYNGTIWNYYQMETMEKRFGGYRDALPVANGIGAVSVDGSHWAVIDVNGNQLSKAEFDEILADGKGVCSRYDTLLARIGSSYYLIDKTGNKLNNSVYSDARPFNDTTKAAVQKNGKWYFVDLEGNEYDLGAFEDAKSFSSGYAAVKIGGTWGYIDENGKLAIEPAYSDAGPMCPMGTSFVQLTTGEWNMLSLIRMNHY